MFALSKWYCDCVSDEGRAFVGYSARMRWGPLEIPYASTLYRPLRGAASERYLIRPCAAPTVQRGELRWDCRHLGVRAAWKARVSGIHLTLLETAHGSITWCCHFPCADAQVDLAGTARLSGLGYAEQLNLSLKPWRLPFERLVWGRFLSAEDALTWIEWDGREPRRWIFHNGVEMRDATIRPESVELANGHGVLDLRDGVALRDGRLGSTALRRIPAAPVWLPRVIRDAHETKWLARGTLTTDTRRSRGWVIHEVIRLR